MDTTALHTLSYGMYLVSAKDGTRAVGCIANSVIQITSSPAIFAVSLNKNNYTASCLQQTGIFAVSVLSENVPKDIIGTFGFSSSKDTDKFAGTDFTVTASGLAIPSQGVCAYLEGRVISRNDCNTHIVFIAEITDARKLSGEVPMTYAYYHRVIKGKAPKNAPTYTAGPETHAKKYTCDLCGYVFEGNGEAFAALPDSYACPICGAPKSCFSLK